MGMGLVEDKTVQTVWKNPTLALLVGQDGTDYAVVKLDPTTRNIETMQHSDIIDVTLSLDTNIYATGDVLANTQDMGEVFRKGGGAGVIQSIQVIDKDDQGCAIDLVFLHTAGVLGVENDPITMADNTAAYVCGIVSVAAADYVDMVNSQLATKANVGLVVQGSSASKHLHIGAVCRSGTPTYTAAGIVVRIGILLD